MNHPPSPSRKLLGPVERKLLRMSLVEDGAFRDLTTLATVPRNLRARGVILARQPGVLAGLPVFQAVYRILDRSVRVKAKAREGASFRRDGVVAEISGPAGALLSGERTALNLLSRLSGIATQTRAFVRAAGPGPARIYDTRKTIPLWRSFERYAVRVGGGENHRFNLATHVLIKDNHRSLGGGVWAAVTAARKRWGRSAFLEAEVESELETREALKAGADALLFDNRSPAELRRLLRLVRGTGVVTEASGGLTLRTIGSYAATGVQRLSVGALTHSALPVDFSLELSGL